MNFINAPVRKYGNEVIPSMVYRNLTHKAKREIMQYSNRIISGDFNSSGFVATATSNEYNGTNLLHSDRVFITNPNYKDTSNRPKDGVYITSNGVDDFVRYVFLFGKAEIESTPFMNREATQFFYADNLEYIPEECFRLCRNLYGVYLAKTKTIDINAFKDCLNLEYVYAPIVKTLKDSAFRDCNSLEKLSLPNVYNITKSVFVGCQSLTTLEIPNATQINYSAFRDLDNLKKVTCKRSAKGTISRGLGSSVASKVQWTYSD